MIEISPRTINIGQPVREALAKIENLGRNLTLFVLDQNGSLKGTLTDGDIRRGLLKKLSLDDDVTHFMFKQFTSLVKGSFTVADVARVRDRGINLVPIVDESAHILKIVDLTTTKTILPLDIVVMAGGEGRRLRPFTETVPKPLLKVGGKAIIEHNLDRLIRFGINDFWICIRYLGHQLIDHLGDGSNRNVQIEFVKEQEPLGTIGAVKKITNFKHDNILVTNSDLLTDLDYEDFYNDFVNREADLSIVTIPYRVAVPFAVLETSDSRVLSLIEKPTYTYYSSAGIYLMKKKVIDSIPDKASFDATDLIELLLNQGNKVISYRHSSYWLDIGRMEDFEKANIDITHLKL